MKNVRRISHAMGCRKVYKSLVGVFAAFLISMEVFANESGLITYGDALWFVNKYGLLQSGRIENEKGSSWITETVTGPGTWSCDWMLSCEENHAFLVLFVDNSRVAYITGGVNWSPLKHELGEGSHTISVEYQKSANSSSEYYDCGCLRNINWVPTLEVGKYFKRSLVDFGYDVPTNGTPYDVVAKGLPAGLKLKYNAAVTKKVKEKLKVKTVTIKKAKCEWWIEGAPTAALDNLTNPVYLVITVNGKTETLPLLIYVRAQDVTELPDLVLGQSLNEQFYLPGVNSGWTVSGLPTGLKYTAKLLTTKKKSGKKTIVTTNALPYSVYGKTTKAGLFTITAKKAKGAYYETMKYRVLVTPKAVDVTRFGDSLTNFTSMAYVPVKWELTNDVSSVGGKVAKVTGLPTGLTFAASNAYGYKDAKKKTGKYLKQSGQTIVGTPTKPGTYAVTFTKNVMTGTGKNKKTVAKTAQILWRVVPSDVELSLGFNDVGASILDRTMGLEWDDSKTFNATPGAKVTVSGLPDGNVKLVDKGDGKWSFTGFATKAGTYLVTVTATLNGKTVRQRVAIKVNGLPSWAKGTFNGITSGPDASINGIATVTVSSVGKISGKFQELGTNWIFSASSYARYFPEYDEYMAPIAARFAYKVKIGKNTVTRYVTRDFNLYVCQTPPGGYIYMHEKVVGGGQGSRVDVYQNQWGTSYKTIGQKLFYTSKKVPYKTFSVKGTTEEGVALGLSPEMSLSLKVTPTGAVTAVLSFDTGKKKKDPKTKKMVKDIYKATCNTVVIPSSPADAAMFTGDAFLYFIPSPANNFPGGAFAIPVPLY